MHVKIYQKVNTLQSSGLFSSSFKGQRLYLTGILAGTLIFTVGVCYGQDESEDVIRLDSVVVEEQAEEPEPELPLGTGMSGDTLKNTAGSGGDPLRTMQALPGMVFADDQSAEPAVRGSRPGDNYFETDFAPMGYLFHAGGVISVFNSELVESFNIYSSAYGPEFNGVTGGVFDVRLRDPRNNRFYTSLDVNFLQTGLLVEGPVTDNQSFYLAGRFSYLDLLVEDQLDEDDGITFEQFPKYTDYQGKYVWHVSDDSILRVQANGATDEFDLTVDENSEEIDNEPIFVGRSFENVSFNQQSVSLDTTFGDAEVKSVIAHYDSSLEQVAGNAGSFDFNGNSWLLKSHTTIPLSDQHDLKFGASLTHADVDIAIAFNDPGCTEFESDCSVTGAERLETIETLKINAYDLFLKDNWYLTDKLTLYPGLAFQSEDLLDKQVLEPRFALEYEWRDDLIFGFALGQYHQLPSFDQINKVFGNPELEYIESNQAVVSVNKKFSNGWDVKTELYYKKLDNLVSGDSDVRFVNGGEGTAYGLDTLARKKLTNRLSGWIALSLSEASRTNLNTGESFPFDFDQPVNLSVVANYKLSKRWTLGAKFWTHSGAVYTPIVGATPDDEIDGFYNPEFGEINSERFPTYTRLDLRIDRTSHRANGKTTSFYFELLNALNSKNVSFYDYNADYTEREKVYQLPIIFGFGVNFCIIAVLMCFVFAIWRALN